MTIPRPVTALRALKVRPGRQVDIPEQVVTEEPLQIQVAGPGQAPFSLAVTMPTPGHDFDLAAGFLVSEGLIGRSEVRSVGYCESVRRGDNPDARYNTVTVMIDRPFDSDGLVRNFALSASCGVCGKTTIEQVETSCPVVPPAAPLPGELIALLPGRLRAGQKTFDRTGGLHGAGLFDPGGRLWCLREDVGRHNAVDKIIGFTALDRSGQAVAGELPGWVLMVSGRVSFEIIQKAAQAGIGTVAAVSAPSSLAVDAAVRFGVALVAFVRGDTYNVYSHRERLDFAAGRAD